VNRNERYIYSSNRMVEHGGTASEATGTGHDRLVFPALFCVRFTLLFSCVVCFCSHLSFVTLLWCSIDCWPDTLFIYM